MVQPFKFLACNICFLNPTLPRPSVKSVINTVEKFAYLYRLEIKVL